MYKILSLFCNVGIAETLLDPTKFKTVVSSELVEKRAKFYNHFFPDVVQVVGDISNEDIKKKIIEASKEAGVDFVMAAPPCQGFSMAGQRRKDDPRNLLTFDAMEIIKALKPKYIFIENVPQFFTDKIIYKNKEVLIPEVIADDFADDYIFQKAILDTQDFGVPQHRRRGIILMSRKDVPVWNFPAKHKKVITVRDAIGHLPSLHPIVRGVVGEEAETGLKHHKRPTHELRHITIMEHTPSGQSAHKNDYHYPRRIDGIRVRGYSSTYKRISWDKPAPTILMASGTMTSQNNVHPGRKLENGKYSDPRVLTLREIFILFTLPPDWDFPKWASDNFVRQVVGEGIPPLFIKEIFKTINN